MTAFYSTPQLDGQYTRQDVRAPYTRGYQSDRLRARKSVESILGTDISPDQKPSIGCNIKWHPGMEPEWFG